LAAQISNTQPISEKIYQKLIEIHGLNDAAPDLYAKQWVAETKNVPCLKWLQDRLLLEPTEIDLENCLEQNWTLSQIRPIQFSIVIHTLPPGIDKALPATQRKMECVSRFEIGVGTAADWSKGLGQIGARLRDMKPDVYINMLKFITAT
jgi:hypothetical protein